ncbi:type IV pilus modification PilV family protein [Marinobacter fonticola]|uniref:type IV pilus modification PilV family protein n=1 Tax=Marinobacter fonticola TaxID=2603215 RepID=UPI0011E72061|nr:type II secretion system protein [Marinobacter fonticola]
MIGLDRRQSGATLVELVMTIVIISIAVAGVVGAFATIAGRSADPLNQTRAVELAQLYLDEILAKKYDELTPEGGVPPYTGGCNINTDEVDRADFDDVDDYHNLTDNPPKSPVTNIAGYSGFQVAVSVACAGGEVGLAAANAKRIRVTITTPGGPVFDFSAYRANF